MKLLYWDEETFEHLKATFRHKLTDGEKLTRIILDYEPRARDSDWYLYLYAWELQGFPVSIPMEWLKKMAKPSTLSRSRRQIQNKEHNFLPTRWEIARGRNIKKDVYQKYYADRKVSPQALLRMKTALEMRV